ncbi:hypothetical protein AAEO56_18755 [Flavobacterium sp. DGU11]|uniref:Lipoprotein n=1 Tax=Flavobacterium arundinis TaxID=3139143 RepID=A0ABU9I1M4_9FLAO
MKYIYTLLCLALIACSDEPEPLKSAQSIQGDIALEATVNNAPADNYSYAEVTAMITGRLSASDQVIFTAENGLFANGAATYTVTAVSGQAVKAYLKYDRAGQVRVTAAAFGKTKEVFLNFVPAWPDALMLSPDTGSLASEYTSNSLITTRLLKNTGVPTQGLLISYRDSIAGGGSVGTFLNNTQSDANGNATVRYWVQDTTHHGFVYIKGEISTPTGVKKAENRIYID